MNMNVEYNMQSRPIHGKVCTRIGIRVEMKKNRSWSVYMKKSISENRNMIVDYNMQSRPII